MPIFLDFSNNCCSHAHILSEKRPISKIQSSNSFIFRIFMKKPLLVCLYFVEKASSCQKQPDLILCLFFFLIFTIKLLLSCPYPVKKRAFSKKQTALIPIFCQKTSIMSKTRFSSHFFFQIFHEKPLLSCPYLVN